MESAAPIDIQKTVEMFKYELRRQRQLTWRVRRTDPIDIQKAVEIFNYERRRQRQLTWRVRRAAIFKPEPKN
jgi:predicted nucleic acid-binding Zn ribbon protein